MTNQLMSPGVQLLYQEVISYIFKEITNGRVLPGQRLTEENIAKELGVSRIPVREAFREMTRQGILVLEPRKGARVATWDANYLDDFGNVRIMIEGEAIKEAAERASNREFKQLIPLIENMQNAYDQNRLDDATEWDLKFHKQIVELSRNPVLISLYDSILLRIKMFMIVEKYIYPPPQGYGIAADEHRSVVHSLLDGDEHRSRDLLQNHLSRSTSELIDRIRKLGANTHDDYPLRIKHLVNPG